MVWGLICATWNWRDDTAYVRMQAYMYNIIYNHVHILYISDMCFMFMCNSLPKPTQHEWVISSYSLSKVEANTLIGRRVVFLYLYYMHIKPWVYPQFTILTLYHTASGTPGPWSYNDLFLMRPFRVFLRTSHETAKDGVSMTPRWITRRTMTGWSQRGLCRPKSWKRRWTKVAENMSMSEECW